MNDEKKPTIGYVISHQFLLDRETNEMIQANYNAPEDAAPLELVMRMRVFSMAAWTAQLANNQRVLARTKLLRDEQDARMHQARVAKLKIDEKVFAHQRVSLNTEIVRLEAEVAADQITLEREQAMTADELAARLRTVQTTTFGETTH